MVDASWKDGSAPPGDDFGSGDLSVADAPQSKLDGLAVGFVLEHDRAGLHPFVAPLGQRDDDRLQLESLLGEQVFRLLAGGSRLPMLHEAGRNETLQALGKDVRRFPGSSGTAKSA